MSKTKSREPSEAKPVVRKTKIERREVIDLSSSVTLARVPEGFAVIAKCGSSPSPYDLRDMLRQKLVWTEAQVEMLKSALVSVGTRAKLDGGGGGKAEGIVMRTPDRSVIAKLRIEDYERALRAQTGRRR